MTTDNLVLELRSIAANPGIIREAADRLDEQAARIHELETELAHHAIGGQCR